MNEFELRAGELCNIFIGFKDGLIKNSNLIDALHFHKLELYARELEVGYKAEKNIKDWVEKFQLMFYRLTSDHHTDLLLILNNVFALIVLFSLAAVILFLCANYLQNWIEIGRECCDLRQSYYLLIILPDHIYEYNKLIVWLEIIAIIALCIIFIALFITVVYCMHYYIHNKYPKICFIILCISTAIILAVKPALILPIFGKLIDESLKVDFPAFTSLSVVYAILMFLLIWSLQKTARKNTIIPN